MRHTPIHILDRHLQGLVKAAVNQAPHVANIAPKSIHMLPAAALRKPLPMLHLATDSNTQLKGSSGVLVYGRPVRLDHHGGRGPDARAEGLAGDPTAGCGGVTGEDLHLAGVHYCDNIECAFAGGADVGLDEGGAALKDVGGDKVFKD
jgi:hypothetical protein